MPELPEVEHLKRTLEPLLIGALIRGVELRRRDVVNRRVRSRRRRIASADLLAGCTIARLVRHGKNLAIVSKCGRSLCVHLGMSGQMVFVPGRERMGDSMHVHCVWRVQNDNSGGRLVFRDPRRFGGIWTFDSIKSLRQARFEQLGPDALTITPAPLRAALAHSHRPIKAALLDQSVLAGVGNIYADESLWMARIHPASIASAIPAKRITDLARGIRMVLRASIRLGGSTIGTYLDGNGEAGEFAGSHQVYGRAGEPCGRCGRVLAQVVIAQRTTVFCMKCQKGYQQPNKPARA